MDPKDQLIQALTVALSKQKATPFYNEPIFLTLLSILLGGIAITMITKHLEHRSKRREMAIDFLNDTGLMLGSLLAMIYGHIKRIDYGKNMSKSPLDLKGDLFKERFGVRVKSKAFLRSEIFWKNYDFLIHEIDLLLFVMRSTDPSDTIKSIDKIHERMKIIQDDWPISSKKIQENHNSFNKGNIKITESSKSTPKKDNNYHKLLNEWVDLIWLRSHLLIQEALEKAI